MYLHELLIDQSNLPFDDYHYWRVEDPEKPCEVLDELGTLCLVATLRMDELEPDDTNMVFMRFPIEASDGC